MELAAHASRIPPTPVLNPVTTSRGRSTQCQPPSRLQSPSHSQTPSRSQSRSHLGTPSRSRLGSYSRSRSRSHPPFQSHSRSLSRTNTSTPQLRSGSPQSGEKRTRPLDDDGEEDEEEDHHHHDPSPGVVHAQKLNNDNSRPKAGDYDSSTQDTILAAASYYRVFLFTENAFPDSATEVQFLRRAWKLANDDSGMEHLILDADIAKIVSSSLLFHQWYTDSIV